MKNIDNSLNTIFKTEIFAKIIKYSAIGIWLISAGMVIFPLPEATLRTQWAFGFIFGLLFMSMTVAVIGGLIQFIADKLNKE